MCVRAVPYITSFGEKCIYVHNAVGGLCKRRRINFTKYICKIDMASQITIWHYRTLLCWIQIMVWRVWCLWALSQRMLTHRRLDPLETCLHQDCQQIDWLLTDFSLSPEHSPTLLNQTDESRLMDYLLSRAKAHGVYTRPVLDPSRSVAVKFGLRLIRVDVTESQNIMTIGAWVRQVIIRYVETEQPSRHYLNQNWARFLTLYGVTWPQWVKIRIKIYGLI